MDNWRLIDFKVANGPDDYRKQMIAEYEQETDTEIIRHFMRAEVCLRNAPIVELNYGTGDWHCDEPTIDFGFGAITFLNDCPIVKKTKMKEMTLEEIEKALGYKVKIINKEE